MKKFIVIILFGLLIMGLSAPVYAQVDFKAWGSLNFGFIWDRNFATQAGNITSYWGVPFYPPGLGNAARWPGDTVTTETSGAWDKSATFMSSYANIFFEWNAGKEVKGVFNIETCNYHSGTNTIGTDNAIYNLIQGAEFDTGLWDTRVGETRLRNAYLEFAVPYIGIPVPMTVRGGVIPMATRPAFMWATTNGAGVQFDVKADPAAFTFTYGKMVENKIAVADDSNFYSLEGRTKAGDIGIGGYIIYTPMKTYPIAYNEDAYGVSQNYNANFWWLGAYADGKMGPVNFNLDFAIDTGKVEARDSGAFAGADDVKYNGWATQLKVTYPYEKWTFGILGLYTSGADLKKTSRTGLPGSTVANGTAASDKVAGWVFPAGDVQWVVWGESMFLGGTWSSLICIPQGMAGANWNTYVSRGATGGTWVAKLWATYPVTPIYKVTLWGLYIGDTTKNGNTMGDAVKSDGTLRDDKDIGWELALINDVQIYKNLNWKVGVGMLFAGDGLDQQATLTTNDSPKNPYMISTVLTYMF
jgi:hypothetical protein